MTNELQETWPIEQFPAHEVMTEARWMQLNERLVSTIVESRAVDKIFENFEQTFDDFLIEEVGIEPPRDGEEDAKYEILWAILIRSVKERFKL